jgi:hypothetical protein
MSSYRRRNCSPVVRCTAYAFTNARPPTELVVAPPDPDTSENVVAEKSTLLISRSAGTSRS